MCKIYLVSTGQTQWDEQDRVESVLGSPLTQLGIDAVRTAGVQLAGREIAAIYAGGSDSEQQAADLLAENLDVRVKIISELRSLDYGLWQGLTVDEIKRRQPRLFKQWIEDPCSICPPGGETLQDASRRLCEAVAVIVRRYKNQAVLLVLRPIMLAIVRCRMEGKPPQDLWQQQPGQTPWLEYEMNAKTISGEIHG